MADHRPAPDPRGEDDTQVIGVRALAAGLDGPTTLLPQLEPRPARWRRLGGRWVAVIAGLVVLPILIPAVVIRAGGPPPPEAAPPTGGAADPVAAAGAAAGVQAPARGEPGPQGVRPPQRSPTAQPGEAGGGADSPPPGQPGGDASPDGPWSTIVDNTSTGRFSASGNWSTSSDSGQHYGADFRYASPVEASDPAWYRVDIPETGRYQVDVWFPTAAGYNDRTPYIVATTGGNQTVHISQQAGGGRWVSLGSFEIAAGDANVVAVSRWRTAGTGYVIADAVRITEA